MVDKEDMRNELMKDNVSLDNPKDFIGCETKIEICQMCFEDCDLKEEEVEIISEEKCIENRIKEETKKILVYGTLTKGNALNPYLNAFKFIGNATLSGYDMYSNGYFPMIVEGKGTIKGEIYEIENGTNEIGVLDRIESSYNRTKVEAKIDGAWIEVYVYVWKYDIKGLTKIESGDWGKQNE